MESLEFERFGRNRQPKFELSLPEFSIPQVMDHHNGTPHPNHSFNLNEQPPVSPYSSKKRKLPHELVGLPLSKYKFRDRYCASDDESSSEDSTVEGEDIPPISVEWRDNKPVGDKVDHSVDSMKFSNSLTGGCATAMTLDAGSKTEISVEEVPHHDQASASSDSHGSNAYDTLHSLDSRSFRNSSAKEQAMFNSKLLEDESCLEQLLEFEAYNDHITSESESNEIGQYAGEKDEDYMLYLNGITSDASTLSTGRWEGKRIAKKPTIDQEFEQYFSMLML